MRKIEISTDTPAECELGDTATGIQRRRDERKQGEGRGGTDTTEEGEGEAGSQEGGHSIYFIIIYNLLF